MQWTTHKQGLAEMQGLCFFVLRTQESRTADAFPCNRQHLIGQSGSKVDRVEPVQQDQAAIIFSFASGTASKKVSIGVLPKHHRP